MQFRNIGYLDQLETFSEWSQNMRSPATYSDIYVLKQGITQTNQRINILECKLESFSELYSLLFWILFGVCFVLIVLLIVFLVILFRQNRKLNCLLSNRYDSGPVYNPHHNDGFSFDPNNNTWTRSD